MFNLFPSIGYHRLPPFEPEPLFTTKTVYYRDRADNEYSVDDVFKIMKMSAQGMSPEDTASILSTKKFSIDAENVKKVLARVDDSGFTKP